MSMGLVVLIIWLLSITEHHCVNTPNLNNSYRSKTVPLFYIKLNFG